MKGTPTFAKQTLMDSLRLDYVMHKSVAAEMTADYAFFMG